MVKLLREQRETEGMLVIMEACQLKIVQMKGRDRLHKGRERKVSNMM